jgi:hypothetical protein
MAGEPATVPETSRQQVKEIVIELPFEDDPTTFLPTLVSLADAHALDEDK